MTKRLVRSCEAWLVEVDIVLQSESTETRRFVVVAPNEEAALKAVVRFPGLKEDDARTIIRKLHSDELDNLRLRPGAVRPFLLRASDRAERPR